MERTAIITNTSPINRALQLSYKNLKQLLYFFSKLVTSIRNSFRPSRLGNTQSYQSMNSNPRRFKFKKLLALVIPLVIIVVLITVVAHTLRSNTSSPTVQTAQASNDGLLKSSKPINKNFDFPLTDDKGKNVGTFSYEIQNAELRNMIFVKGQKAESVPGRVFLIINLKLKNALQQGLQINTRDYIRLTVNNNNSEMLAPDIHNDPIELQAISTEFTRVGFAINQSDKDLMLHVGEINGKKTDIPIQF